MTVGVLALQGDFQKHGEAVKQLGGDVCYIRTASDLNGVSALILPGGESTTLLRLLTPELREALIERVSSGMPTLATCAGLILISFEIRAPRQESLKLLNIEITRNGYGRQRESFIDDSLELTEAGKELLSTDAMTGVFIRAPRITWTGESVETLATRNSEPVLVREGKILGATFHPELSHDLQIHQFLLAQV